MQYLPNTNKPALRYDELVPVIVPKGTYDSWKDRGKIEVYGRGGNGSTILISFYSLPVKPINYQQLVKEKYGDPSEYIASQPIKSLLKPDGLARQFYATEYRLPDGRDLPLEYQLKYARQAEWLNVIKMALTNKAVLKDTLHINVGQFWEAVSKLINTDKEQEHGLPESIDRLQRKYRKYVNEGYKGLVDEWRFCNDNARVVTPKIEGLILALYCEPSKPYMNYVCKEFRKFIKGERLVVDLVTGEKFDPTEFYVKGKPYELGESTVDYYVKKPFNLDIVNKGRMNKLAYNTEHRPSVARKAPYYAFSKITMDDVDIPFKDHEGKRPVKSYQIFDVASGACIGVAFGRDKNVELIREALRDMFRLIVRNNWGIPWEIEFEKHLTTAMTGGTEWDDELEMEVMYQDILTPGAVFPATRMCLGGNAKEKRAEGFIRIKKYGQQKKRPGFQARHYAKLLTNRLNKDQDSIRYSYEEIVDNELADIAAHNNELHPKQDLYPNMTRWEVLTENQNPNLAKYQAHTVIKFIGFRTETSIKAGKCQVQYNDYMLPDMLLLGNLKYNGLIEAYYMPDENGDIPSVHLFENGQYICEAYRKGEFQEAIIEQTDEDKLIAKRQWSQQAHHDSIVKLGTASIAKVATIHPDEAPQLPQGNARVVTIKSADKEGEKPRKRTKKAPLNGGYSTDKSAESRGTSDVC